MTLRNLFKPTTHIAAAKSFDVPGWIRPHVSELVFKPEHEEQILLILQSSYVSDYSCQSDDDGFLRISFDRPEYLLETAEADLTLLTAEIIFEDFAPQFRGRPFIQLIFELTSLSLWDSLTLEQVKLVAYSLACNVYQPYWQTGDFLVTPAQKNWFEEQQHLAGYPSDNIEQEWASAYYAISDHQYAEFSRMFQYFASAHYTLEPLYL